ncbi:MAG: deoxyguanosinetriphosphate triphosphohydrolase [Pseudomonadales bacterium]|nr:deoxyguanosinetriphosphate triphosphohydrolase [Pseudomonadales bacterium]
MDWQHLLCAERLGGRPAKTESGRSPFLSDHDKIIFSGAFRRLARKTQVHPMATNDHIHNRMTHSLEVACVGRSLAIRVGQALAAKQKLPQHILPTDLGDIVQSTCLAHDIGNPPFGHTGEEAIRNWFQQHGQTYLQPLSVRQQNDLLRFEGNAQGLRILTSSEYHQFDGGMRLTYATLASFIKYPWGSDQQDAPKTNKYGIYDADRQHVDEIAERTALLENSVGYYCRHPLVYLMEAADDFCYGILDLEDGLEMGLVSWEEMFQLIKPVLRPAEVHSLEQQIKRIEIGRRPPFIRGKIIDAYIEAGVDAYMRHEQAFLAGEVKHDLISLCRPEITESVNAAKTLAKARIFSHPRKVELEIGAYDVIARLLDKVIPALDEWYQQGGMAKSKENQMMINLIGEKNIPKTGDYYQTLMAGIDFVSGMTDNYASHLSRQFSGMAYANY